MSDKKDQPNTVSVQSIIDSISICHRIDCGKAAAVVDNELHAWCTGCSFVNLRQEEVCSPVTFPKIAYSRLVIGEMSDMDLVLIYGATFSYKEMLSAEIKKRKILIGKLP